MKWYDLIVGKAVLLFILLSSLMWAQKADVSGFVYDESNGEALIGANVYLKDVGTGATTNISGYFVIPDVPFGKHVLAASYMGFTPQTKNLEIKDSKNNTYTFRLSTSALETEEIVVSADSVKLSKKLFSKPISKIELSQAQVNAIPKVIEADLLRALQTLPGITALSDFSSALYVRGGTPDQNLFLIDGTDVYNPEHAFGIFSTFNTNSIKKVEISKGGFNAQYGGRLSSVLDVTQLDGNRNKFQGDANISLLSASATLQAPIGSFGSISGSFRRTYIDQTYSKWIDDVPDYYFYDGHLKAFLDLGQNDKLSLSFFKSSDVLNFVLDEDAKESFGFDYDWGNTTTSVNWRHIFGKKLFGNFWFTTSNFSSRFDMPKIFSMTEDNKIKDYTAKAALEYFASSNLDLKFGFEHKVLNFLYRQEWDQGLININRDRQLSTGYIQSSYKPSDSWEIETGLRVNFFNSDSNSINYEPRFSVKYKIDEESSVKFATGRYYQYLNRIPRAFMASIWTSSDKYTKNSSSDHFILGYQRAIGDIVELEADIYYKNYKNIYSFNQLVSSYIEPSFHDNMGRPVFEDTKNIFNRGDGKSYGAELMLRKNIGAVTGWVSYSWSETKYTFDVINQAKEFTPRHNRENVVNFVLNSDIGSLFSGKWNSAPEKSSSRWLIGINFVYASGQTLTVPNSGYYNNTLPDWQNLPKTGDLGQAYKLYPGSINNYKLPAYSRLDLSLTYEKDYGSWTLAPYIQIFNLGNRKNVWFIDYEQELKDGVITQKATKTTMLPLLPSIGVNIKF